MHELTKINFHLGKSLCYFYSASTYVMSAKQSCNAIPYQNEGIRWIFGCFWPFLLDRLFGPS